jgi:drug/metabolite transporter (DMT)-like permease
MRQPVTTSPLTFSAIWQMGYLSIVCGLTLFPLWYWVMERLPLGLMGITLFVQAPSAALVGWLFYSQKLMPASWQGGILIFVSLWLCTYSLRPRAARESPDAEPAYAESAP